MKLVKTMRASFVVLGPLLARIGRARVSTPGGMRDRCASGEFAYRWDSRARQARSSFVTATSKLTPRKLTGGRIWLDSPSVGATENIMMAAVMARGHTAIGKCGARTRGAGPRASAGQDGREDQRRRHACDRNRGRRAAAWRRARSDTGPNRGRLDDGGGPRSPAATLRFTNAPIEHLDSVATKLREAGRRGSRRTARACASRARR